MLLMLTLHMHTLGLKLHKGAAQMPHHIHMRFSWPPTINIAMSHQVHMHAITEPPDPGGMPELLRLGSIRNVTYFVPSMARERTNLSYIFEGMAHSFLHLGSYLETQGAPAEPRSRRQAIHKRRRSPKSASGKPPAPHRILYGLE